MVAILAVFGYNRATILRRGVKYVAFFGLIKNSDDYTVRDKTGREIPIRDAEKLEEFAKEEQKRNHEQDKDVFQRIFSRHN
ncbi:hypothetical protein IKF74_02330 [Candidatus Saccharibacteria bacterium]|nr:hypothetical protein [Candidatus Saccharibacteria bacterium]